MIKVIAPALLFATITVGPASADSFVPGNDLDKQCRKDSRLFAMGYVVGVADLLQNTAPGEICISENATAGQLVDIFCEYIKDNPKERHFSGDYLAFSSLAEAFPCKK